MVVDISNGLHTHGMQRQLRGKGRGRVVKGKGMGMGERAVDAA